MANQLYEYINHVYYREAVKIPVFANGNILCYDDIVDCMEQTGCEGVMIAESNLYNPCLFAQVNPPVWDIANEYLNFVEQYPCSFGAIRAHVFKIFHKVYIMQSFHVIFQTQFLF